MVIGARPVGTFGIGTLGIIEAGTPLGAPAIADTLYGVYEPCLDDGRKSILSNATGPFFARGPIFWKGGAGRALLKSDSLTESPPAVPSDDGKKSQPDFMRVVGLMWEHAPLSYELKKSRNTIARSFLEIYEGSVYKDEQLISNEDIGKLMQNFWYVLMSAPRDVGADENVLAITHFIACGHANRVDPALHIDVESKQVSTKKLVKLTAILPHELELICGLFSADIAARLSDVAEGRNVKLHPFVRTQMNVLADGSEVAVEHHVASAILDLRDEGRLPAGLVYAHGSEIDEVVKMQDIFWKELDNPFERNISMDKLREFVRDILRSDPFISRVFSPVMLENLVNLAVLTVEHRVGLDTVEANRILRPNPVGGPPKALPAWVRGFVEEIHSKPKDKPRAEGISSVPPLPPV